jgi:hypothetical protein
MATFLFNDLGPPGFLRNGRELQIKEMFHLGCSNSN